MTKCLIVSNGHGEDYIGAQIAHAIRDLHPSFYVSAFPLVGDGYWYRHTHIPVLAHARSLPSGGFIRTISDLWKDLRSGMINQLISHFLKIRACRAEFDHVICVGDVFCLCIGHGKDSRNTAFIPTAKSDRFMPHSWIERVLMSLFCATIFTRDSDTAASLVAHHLPALYLGNPMFDGLEVSERHYSFGEELPVVGVLPGSRDEAISNLTLILNVCTESFKTTPFHLFLAKAPTLDNQALIATLLTQGWVQEDVGVFVHAQVPICRLIITDHFPDMLANSRLIIGLAGTANEQAVYWGKTVMTFPGSGPQTTLTRCMEQKKLLGDLIDFTPTQAIPELAHRLNHLLKTVDSHCVRPQNRQASTAIARSILA